MARKADRELEEYRSLMTVPSTFEHGFSLSSFFGVLFIALVMVPGAFYMELLAGTGIGPAAQWVTVILFIEVAKRANAKMSRATLFVLFYMAGSIVSQGVQSTPLFTQFLVRSEAALSFGLANQFPVWVAPTDPAAYETRSFFQLAWLPALGLVAFKMFFSKLDTTVLGYGLFRVTSDVEKLPFPLAPIGAQGVMALADDLDGQAKSGPNWRWRVFAIGGALGMGFGLLYYGLPTLSGALLGRTMQIFPIPFVDWTPYTKDVLPATATGLCFDLGQVVMGMVMPYFAMVGTFIGLVVTVILNPILYRTGVLRSWSPGDSTVETMFKNNVDFYLSLGIGLSLAVAVIGVASLVRLSRAPRVQPGPGGTVGNVVPPGRGDIPNFWILATYLFCTSAYIALSGWLIDWHRGVMIVLFFYGFIYTPLISYVTARLEGLAGQVVEIPFIKEISLILSGYQGVAVWFIPIPKSNYGVQTVLYRQAELTGTKFTSLWKAEAFMFPVLLISSLAFASFIWGLAEIPSAVYPYTQQIWELDAKNQMLIFSSTSGEYSQFHEALSAGKVGLGLVIGLALFGGLTLINAPIMLLYGLIRGIGQTLPHVVIPQFIGALLGRYYFEKRMGLQWRQYVPVLSAGFFCGAGLVTMFCVGIVFLTKASNHLPY